MKSRDYREIISSLKIEGLEERSEKHKELERKRAMLLGILFSTLMISILIIPALATMGLDYDLFFLSIVIAFVIIIISAIIMFYMWRIDRSREELSKKWLLISHQYDLIWSIGTILPFSLIILAFFLIFWRILVFILILIFLLFLPLTIALFLSYRLSVGKFELYKIFELKIERRNLYNFLTSAFKCYYNERFGLIECGELKINMLPFNRATRHLTLIRINNIDSNNAKMARDIVRKVEEYASKLQVKNE